MPGFDMSDYVPVNERIEAFIKSYPEGSLQSEIVELTESRVTVKAYAYRKPDDPRPGTGLSSLEIPGSTTFTRGSEIENAETSAWGRAIAALGFEVKRGIASHEEVRNKQSQASASGEARPAAKPAAAKTAATATFEDGTPIEEPYDEDTLDAIAQASGGEVVDLPDHIKRAQAKAAGQAAQVCPVHGPDKVKKNRRGLYCATKLENGEWCDWQVAA